jgi:hypothetical protein
VLVDGAPGHDGQILDLPCELRVGSDGPRVFLEADAVDVHGQTVGARVVEPDVHARVEKIAGSERVNRLAVVLTLALIAVSLVAGWLAVVVVRERADRSTALAAKALERSEAARIEALESIDRSKLDFARVFETARRSVYLVAERLTKGSSEIVSPLATAWVVGDGILATNAHVAESFDPAAPSAFFLRSCSDPPVDVRVRSVRLHPGYATFANLVNGADGTPRAFDAAAASFLAMLPACDVAIVEVEPDESGRLGPPLPVAEKGALEALTHGEPLGLIGFPSEGLIRGGTDAERPQPTAQTGAVTAVTDFFLARTAASDAQLVQFSMSAAGGASGSPVLNRAGRVVAILSGGNSVTLGGGIPRLPVGGVNYGQRIDLLLELIDLAPDALASAQARRTAAWRAQVAAIFEKGTEGLFIYLVRDHERQLTHRLGRPTQLVEFVTKEFRLDPTAAEDEFRFQAPADGLFVAIAVAGKPLDVDAAIGVEGAVRGIDNGADYFPSVEITASRGETIILRVWPSARAVAEPTPVRARVYQAVDG